MKVWRNGEGREFPATYHYAPDMPGYHSASVGKYTVADSLIPGELYLVRKVKR